MASRSQKFDVLNVSQASMRPDSRPALNQCTRCCGGAMREGVRNDAARHLSLNHVVADLRRRVQCFLDIAGLQAVLHLIVEVRPNARQAVGLQFRANLNLVGSGFVLGAVLQLLHLVENAELVLHVMADFVGDDVGLSEVAAAR